MTTIKLSGGMSSEQFRFPATDGRSVPCIQMITLLCSEKFIEEISSDFFEVLVSSFCKKRKRDLPFWLVDIATGEHEEKTKINIKVRIKF